MKYILIGTLYSGLNMIYLYDVVSLVLCLQSDSQTVTL